MWCLQPFFVWLNTFQTVASHDIENGLWRLSPDGTTQVMKYAQRAGGSLDHRHIHRHLHPTRGAVEPTQGQFIIGGCGDVPAGLTEDAKSSSIVAEGSLTAFNVTNVLKIEFCSCVLPFWT